MYSFTVVNTKWADYLTRRSAQISYCAHPLKRQFLAVSTSFFEERFCSILPRAHLPLVSMSHTSSPSSFPQNIFVIPCKRKRCAHRVNWCAHLEMPPLFANSLTVPNRFGPPSCSMCAHVRLIKRQKKMTTKRERAPPTESTWGRSQAQGIFSDPRFPEVGPTAAQKQRTVASLSWKRATYLHLRTPTSHQFDKCPLSHFQSRHLSL